MCAATGACTDPYDDARTHTRARACREDTFDLKCITAWSTGSKLALHGKHDGARSCATKTNQLLGTQYAATNYLQIVSLVACVADWVYLERRLQAAVQLGLLAQAAIDRAGIAQLKVYCGQRQTHVYRCAFQVHVLYRNAVGGRRSQLVAQQDLRR